MPEIRAQPSTNVVVSFSTTNATPLNLGFAGFTTEMLGMGMEYGDTNMQQFAASFRRAGCYSRRNDRRCIQLADRADGYELDEQDRHERRAKQQRLQPLQLHL